jgi:hypothetical protein
MQLIVALYSEHHEQIIWSTILTAVLLQENMNPNLLSHRNGRLGLIYTYIDRKYSYKNVLM